MTLRLISNTRASEPGTMTSLFASLGTLTYRVSPGLALVGLKVMRFTVRSAFIAPRTLSECEGSRLGGTAMVYNVFFKHICILVMAEGGYDPTDPTTEKTPLIPDTGDDDDDTGIDWNTPLDPADPYHGGEEHEMSQLPQEQSGQDTDPLSMGDELDQQLQQTRQGSAWADLLEMYPQANKDALDVSYEKDKKGNPRLAVKMVGRGKGKYFLFTRNAVTRQLRENPDLSQEIKTYLGKSMGEQMNDFQQEKAKKEAELAAKQRQLEQIQQRAAESQKLRRDMDALTNAIRDAEAQRRKLEDAHGPIDTEAIQRLKDEKRRLEAEKQAKNQKLSKLQKGAKQADKIQAEVDKLRLDDRRIIQELSEMRAKQDARKPLDALEKEVAELKRKIEADRQIMNDENATSRERMAAGVRFSENTDELARLDTEVQEREQEMPLRERVKNIFKKYGWTLQAVALAVGVVLSALALAATNGLKAGTKALGNGLKDIGQKLGSLLPGLIGSIVSYIFKTASSVLSFLGKHAWLLILAVVAFFMERLLKKSK